MLALCIAIVYSWHFDLIDEIFENLNSISNIFQKPHDFLIFTSSMTISISFRSNQLKVSFKKTLMYIFLIKGTSILKITEMGFGTQRTKTSLRRLQDVFKRSRRLMTKTSDLRRLEDVWFTTSWRCPIYLSWRRLSYDVLKTSDLCRLEDVQFTTSSRCLTYDVLRTFDLWRLDDFHFTTSSRHL